VVSARLPRGLCALVVAGALAAGCGVPLDDETQTIPSDDVPFDLLDNPTTTSTTTTVVERGPTTTVANEIVNLYFVRNDRIERVDRLLPELTGMEDRLMMLAEPLRTEETQRGYRSAVPVGSILGVTPRGGVATVDLARPFTELPTSEQVLAFAQITNTLLKMPGVGQVAFTLETVPISPIDDDLTVLTRPATFEDYADLVAS
jgi:hypothetical protein